MSHRIELMRLAEDGATGYHLEVEGCDALGLGDGAILRLGPFSNGEAVAILSTGAVSQCNPPLVGVSGTSGEVSLEIHPADTQDPIMRWDLSLCFGEGKKRTLTRIDGATARMLNAASEDRIALPELMLEEDRAARAAFDDEPQI